MLPQTHLLLLLLFDVMEPSSVRSPRVSTPLGGIAPVLSEDGSIGSYDGKRQDFGVEAA